MTILKWKECTALLASMVLLPGCDKESPTVPNSSGASSRATAGTIDSTAKRAGTPSGVTTAAVSVISLQAGDKVNVFVQSYECSGNPETVIMSGILSGVVASGSCAGGLGGQGGTFGPASGAGTISFTANHQDYGTGPAGAVSGANPNYTVGLNDGYGDTDFNDVILSVQVIRQPGTLTCTPAPFRGQDVICEVKGSGVTVTGWAFDGPTFQSGGTHHITAVPSGNIWKGKAVASGTVTAQTSFNGNPQEPLTASFTVQPRPTWHWTKKDDWRYDKNAINCAKGIFVDPEPETLVGWSRRKGTCENNPVTPNPLQFPNEGYKVASVPSGPNMGLWYVTTVSYKLETQSNINPAIKSGSSTVFPLVSDLDKAACGTLTKVNFYDYNSKCHGYNVTPFLNGIWNHEGYGASNNTGHQAHLEIAAARPEMDLHKLVEGVFDFGESKTRQNVVAVASFVTLFLNFDWANEATVKDNWCGFVWKRDTTQNQFFFVQVTKDDGNCL
jgi:hypothetical protein